METLNLKPVFLPNHRANANVYWLGLGLIAALDAVRLTIIDGVGLITWFVVLFFLAVLHANRLRDAGRPSLALIIPLLFGTLAKLVASVIAMGIALAPLMIAYLQAQGYDVEDPEVLTVFAEDLQLQADFQASLMEDIELRTALMQSLAWPSTWAFWIVVGLIGRWFASQPSRA